MRETRFDPRYVSLSIWFAVMDVSELRMVYVFLWL